MDALSTVPSSSAPTAAASAGGFTSPAGQDTTRILCAAVHVDAGLAHSVLDEVLYQPHHAVAPSYGIDIAPIVRHAIAAQNRVMIRNIVITAVVTVALVLSFGSTLATLLVLVGIGLAVAALLHLAKGDPKGAAIRAGGSFLALAVGFGGPAVQAQLSGGVALDESADPAVLLAVVLTLAAWAVLWTERLSIHRMVALRFRPEHFSVTDAPTEPAGQRERLQYLSDAQHGNVTVYSQTAAHRLPFVGSGSVIDSWSIASPLMPSEDRMDGSPPLSATDLYDAMRRSLVSLASPRLDPERRVAGLSLQDRLLVGGLLTPDHPLVDSTRRRPILRVTPETIRRAARSPRGQERHYLTIRVASWGGEVEVTCFLFASVRGDMLFLEFVATAMPGVRQSYHRIDELAQLNTASLAAAGLSALADAPVSLVLSPFSLAGQAVQAFSRWFRAWRQTLSIGYRIAWDYGASTSVRELAAAPMDQVFFQRLDSEQHVRIVARQVIAAVIDALETNGYDTSDFDHRANTAIDNSVTIVDSKVSDAAFATGEGSSASAKRRTRRRAESKT